MADKLLTEGFFFGEVGVLYNCKRTATVISRNYNTIATLTSEDLDDISQDYPMFEANLYVKTFKYRDTYKQMIRNAIQKIEYL